MVGLDRLGMLAMASVVVLVADGDDDAVHFG